MLKARFARVVAATLLATVGCAGDTNREFSLRGQLDGVPFEAAGVTASMSNSVLQIAGATSQAIVRMTVLVPPSPGTVTFTADSTAISFGEISSPLSVWSTVYGGDGTVTFTRTAPEEMTGTFVFAARITPGQTGAATRTITGGSFVVRF